MNVAVFIVAFVRDSRHEDRVVAAEGNSLELQICLQELLPKLLVGSRVSDRDLLVVCLLELAVLRE